MSKIGKDVLGGKPRGRYSPIAVAKRIRYDEPQDAINILLEILKPSRETKLAERIRYDAPQDAFELLLEEYKRQGKGKK
jgi:hypothetical protein